MKRLLALVAVLLCVNPLHLEIHRQRRHPQMRRRRVEDGFAQSRLFLTTDSRHCRALLRSRAQCGQ